MQGFHAGRVCVPSTLHQIFKVPFRGLEGITPCPCPLQETTQSCWPLSGGSADPSERQQHRPGQPVHAPLSDGQASCRDDPLSVLQACNLAQAVTRMSQDSLTIHPLQMPRGVGQIVQKLPDGASTSATVPLLHVIDASMPSRSLQNYSSFPTLIYCCI